MKNKKHNIKTSFGTSVTLSNQADLFLLQKEEQKDELSYLSGLAFEQFVFDDNDLDSITQRINKKMENNVGLRRFDSAQRSSQSQLGVKKQTGFTTVFISLLIGLFIGVSVFFVLFNKSKNHASVYQNLANENELLKKALNNRVVATDTVFNIPQNSSTELKEHFTTQDELIIEPKTVDEFENLEPKTVTLPVSDVELKDEITHSFIPNAPVLFISDLKVANYKTYYFKQNQSIDLALNNGLSAQYENESQLQKVQRNRNSNYFAHVMVQRAMKLFNQKQFDACIEELKGLYDYNKEDANAQFYLGMCYVEKQQYQQALILFENNLENDVNIFHQEAEYYKAICLLKTNKLEQAKQLFQKIKSNNGFYASRVGDWLEK